MTSDSPQILEQLLRDNNLGWRIDMYSPQKDAVPFLLNQLQLLASEFKKRFGYEDLSFAPEQLIKEAKRNPHKIRAFLQSLLTTDNTDMLLMVWRILQGLSIRQVMLEYVELDSFRLKVVLARSSQEGAKDALEEYSSDDINDAKLLRQFAIAKTEKRPLFVGYFPMNDE